MEKKSFKRKIKIILRRIFHKRIARLHPVVALDEEVNLIYGRYDTFNEYDESGNPHTVITHDGFISDCFAVKKITEEQYIAFTQKEA